MEKYITQLIQDIQDAITTMQPPWIQKESYSLDEWLSEEEDWKQAPRRSVEDWTGIKKIQFPPEEKLTNEQIEVLLNAAKKLLDAVNCCFVVIFTVPNRIQYKMMREMWHQESAWLMWRENFFDFCEREQEHGTCGFGLEYCHCHYFAEMSKDWDNSPWTEEDEERWQQEMEERERRRRRDRDDWGWWDDEDIPFR